MLLTFKCGPNQQPFIFKIKLKSCLNSINCYFLGNSKIKVGPSSIKISWKAWNRKTFIKGLDMKWKELRKIKKLLIISLGLSKRPYKIVFERLSDLLKRWVIALFRALLSHSHSRLRRKRKGSLWNKDTWFLRLKFTRKSRTISEVGFCVYITFLNHH